MPEYRGQITAAWNAAASGADHPGALRCQVWSVAGVLSQGTTQPWPVVAAALPLVSGPGPVAEGVTSAPARLLVVRMQLEVIIGVASEDASEQSNVVADGDASAK